VDNAGIGRPDTTRVLGTLKPFQRDTVEYVFQRMYTDEDCTKRFLVADEVGLGKTLVARGLIARAIDHLEERVDRIDIVYICSNADIARQNLQRLNLTEDRDAARVGRLTMLPAMLPKLDPRLNFVAFTPGTSFNMGSSTGTWQERALLFWMLEDLGRLPVNARGKPDSSGAPQLFQGGVYDLADWKARLACRWLPAIGSIEIEPVLLQRFDDALQNAAVEAAKRGEPDLQARITTACARLKGRRIQNAQETVWREANSIVGELRMSLARACLSALEPDLVILDEFQRFKELLDPHSEAGALAHNLFNYADQHGGVRTVLLSATPYKMYTLHAEVDSDDHYKDFMCTFSFLFDSEQTTAETAALLARMRRALYRIPASGPQEALECRAAIEDRLRKVMVRTEHVAGSEGGDDMLQQATGAALAISAREASHYLGLQRIARSVNGPEMIEYWKSAPYLLNFMDEYQVKETLRQALQIGRNPSLAYELRRHSELLLTQAPLTTYDPIEAGNPRLRRLIEEITDQGLWRMAWIPPSLPPYRLAGAYEGVDYTRLTKRLIFSAWRVVPKTIAGLVSYDVERRLHKRFDPKAVNTPEARSALPRPLRLDVSDGRPTGLPLFTLLYPCASLAGIGADALREAAQSAADGVPDLEQVLAKATRAIESLLPEAALAEGNGRADESWYWVAPLLLDLEQASHTTRTWWNAPGLAYRWARGDREASAVGWNEHLDRARQVMDGWRPEGPPPGDLAELLAEVAVAGPATTALRSLRSVTGYAGADTPKWLQDAAAHVGWVYRRLFNQIEISILIRGEYGETDNTPYWRKVLRYALDGGLSAVNDEYFHVLSEATGAGTCDAPTACERIVQAVAEGTALSPRWVEWDEITLEDDNPVLNPRRRLRTHFAFRFGQGESEDGVEVTHEDQVRAAFNSPFWPFILASTSVGQEGLDFHPYCHAIVHWNLPNNPVDMEQREGRVHRYKGHAVRKNLAKRFYREGRTAADKDRWHQMFNRARDEHPSHNRGLVPEWNYPTPGGARIERHVPVLPFSRDAQKYERLRYSLAVYRMVFGQARQEDLVAYLQAHVDAQYLDGIARKLRIDLSPPGTGTR